MARTKTLGFTMAGYLIEQSLSVDNMFVFVMIFTCFAVRQDGRKRVAALRRARGDRHAGRHDPGRGLAGAAVRLDSLRFAGAFLVITGIKMLVFAEARPDLEQNPLLRLLRRRLRITPEFHGEHFFVRHKGVLWATPMFLVLILIRRATWCLPSIASRPFLR